MKKILLFCLLPACSLRAQDIHYSQFYAAPVVYNPASAGLYTGDFRLANNYKSQWKSIASPYKTFSASYDMSMFKEKWGNDFLGVGVGFTNDKAGDAGLGSTQVSFSLSSCKMINEGNKQFLAAGLQAAYNQRTLNSSKLTWDNQYDGLKFDPSRPSREYTLNDSKSFVDAGAGIQWMMMPEDKLNADFGIAAFHLNRPNQSLVSSATDKLNMKIVVNGGAKIMLPNNNVSFIPRALYTKQGTQQELVAGMLIRYLLQDKSKYTGWVKETAFTLGGMYRVGDAVIVSSRFEYQNISLGISYDVNISDLRSASDTKGGMEFSLSYIGAFSAGKYGAKN